MQTVEVCAELILLAPEKALEIKQASLALEQTEGADVAMAFTYYSAKRALTNAKLEALLK